MCSLYLVSGDLVQAKHSGVDDIVTHDDDALLSKLTMLFHVFESFSTMSIGEVDDGLVGLVAAALSVSDYYCNIYSSCLCIRVKMMDIDHDCCCCCCTSQLQSL